MNAPAATSAPGTRMRELFDLQRAAFARDPWPDAARRADRLRRLLALTRENAREFAAAISADFGQRPFEVSDFGDFLVVEASVRHALRNLKRWMRPRRVATPLHLLPARARVLRQPLGVVGIVAPWNYPYNLALDPAVGALAAGNRVMLKPDGELTRRFAALLAERVARYFAADELAIVLGGAEQGAAFAALPFDHLLFTGSARVGRLVAAAAAANLTPVTLELGGKSPCIVDASCDLARAVPRIVHGKLFNAGQTCVAPDYVLLPGPLRDAFVQAWERAAARMYPSLEDNPDYASIVSDRHYARLEQLAADAAAQGAELRKLNPAGEALPAAKRKFPPTLALGVTDSMRLMQEEIFGPILPVVTYRSLAEAIDFVNARPRPLSLYWFGDDAQSRERVLASTIAGGVCVNDTLIHLAHEGLPFGGVGASGYGSYHGEAGFLTFTKQKAVLIQGRLNLLGAFFPPYGARFKRLISIARRLL
jgi:coniferyl-aldehyde dehydrogenase